MSQKKTWKVDRMNKILTCSYLFAIIIANFTIHKFGPKALPITAFFLIPFDLVARDFLHERWKKHLKLKMFLLIGSGSILSFLLNYEVKNIALASIIAFGSSGIINTALFELLKAFKRSYRMNTSNLFAAINDSILFQWIAFGSISKQIAIEQTTLKFIGGVFWIYIITKLVRKYEVSKRKGLRRF